MVVRGCGTRQEGGVYAECRLSPFGRPLEDFLFDPPRPVDPDALGLSEIGVLPVRDQDGTTHLMDWIGRKHYPTPADFIEEVRRFGMSRRLPRSLDFRLLTPRSKMLLVHAEGLDWNHRALYEILARNREGWSCPKGLPEHAPTDAAGRPQVPVEMCAGLWWEAVPHNAGERHGRAHMRRMPSFSYPARTLPEGHRPDYQPAIIAAFPISNLAVIRAQDGGHEAAAEKAIRATIPLVIEDK